MIFAWSSQCLTCKHRKWPADRRHPTQRCAAFPLPAGIPAAIWNNRVDHRQPFPGDQGYRWTTRRDRKFPTYAIRGYVEPDDPLHIPESKLQPPRRKRRAKKPTTRFD